MNYYTEKNIDDALASAAAEKGCELSDLKYFVKEEKKGLLGIGASVTIGAYTVEDVKEFLFDYLGNFFVGIDQDIEVSIEDKVDSFVVRLNAENNAILIGKMGKTLAAFNTVVRSALNSEFKTRIDVLIDVNNYKGERYSKLIHLAKRTAKQVQRSHVDAELDPMSNDERKVIHKALGNWHNIRTDSEGEGSERHICIRYVPDPVKETETTEEVSTETVE